MGEGVGWKGKRGNHRKGTNNSSSVARVGKCGTREAKEAIERFSVTCMSLLFFFNLLLLLFPLLFVVLWAV